MPEEIAWPKMPSPEDGLIPTLNQMGDMTQTLDPYSRQFVDFAPMGPGRALEIGAAYGVATIAALNKGASVVANDLEPKHLEILWNRTPEEHRGRLELRPGAFPDGLEVEMDHFGSILICRVMHFLQGSTIERSIELFFQALRKKGKLFIVADTPYVSALETFIPTYESRRRTGEKWPGLMTNFKSFDPENAYNMPDLVHWLDAEVLSRSLRQAGFKVEQATLFARPDYPDYLQYDGRESVGIVASKK